MDRSFFSIRDYFYLIKTKSDYIEHVSFLWDKIKCDKKCDLKYTRTFDRFVVHGNPQSVVAKEWSRANVTSKILVVIQFSNL